MTKKMDEANMIRVSSMATKSDHARWTAFDETLMNSTCTRARDNARKREIHFFHEGDEDTLHRMLNCVQPGSYIRPHRHLEPPKGESVVLLKGVLGVVFFSDNGQAGPDDFVLLNAVGHESGHPFGVDIRAGVWHTFFALEPDTVLFEVKPGPYSKATDKDFATWAPEPGSAGASTYFMELEDRFRDFFKLPARPWGSGDISG